MKYIDYDDFGIVNINCMCCGKQVCKRVTKKIKIKTIPPKEECVITIRKLGSYRRKAYDLEDGSYMEAILCSDCVNKNIDLEKIEQDVEDTWVSTWEWEGKDGKTIKKLKEKNKIKIKQEKIKEKGNKQHGLQ